MIFITGDTHGGHGYFGENDLTIKLNSKAFDPSGLTKNDYVIITGDFGLLFSNNENDPEEKHWLKWLEEKPWTTLFIDGNHENHLRLYDLPSVDMFGDKVGKVSESIYHLKRGRVYTIDGEKFFTMGGARSHDIESRKLFIDYWPAELPNNAEEKLGLENLEKHNWTVDYIITHAAPQSIVNLFDTDDYYCASNYTKTYLELLRTQVKYKMWYFGHYHDDEIKGPNYRCVYHEVIKL